MRKFGSLGFSPCTPFSSTINPTRSYKCICYVMILDASSRKVQPVRPATQAFFMKQGGKALRPPPSK